MTLVLLGPISSARPEGPGHLYSWLCVGVGCWTLTEAWVRYVKHRRKAESPILDLVENTILSLVFLGLGALGIFGTAPELWPIFSGTGGGGPGPFFSVFFLVLGSWLAIRTWVWYAKHHGDARITVFALVLTSMVSLFFIFIGVHGVVRWAGAHFVSRTGG